MIRRLLIEQKQRESIAVLEGGRALRYQDLIEKAESVRALLPRENRGAVAILLPNGGRYIAALWGVLMAGRVAFPLNPSLTGYELLPQLSKASVAAVVTTAAHRRVLEQIPGWDALSPELIEIDGAAPPACEDTGEDTGVAADAPMLLLSTSGTAGRPKIVQLSERNIETAVLGYLDKLRFSEEELPYVRYALAAPYSSVYGMMILSACLMRSFPIVVLDDAFTLDAFYRAVERHRITHYEGGTAVILLMAQTAGRAIPYAIHTLRHFGFGGSKVSGDTIERLQRAYPGREFYQGYGMTEASPLITKHPQGKLEKPKSVGTAIRGAEIAVAAASGITKAPRERGEIVVRGQGVMLGYLEDQPETDRVLKNGFLYTGDIGYLDEEGHLYLCGRKKNVMIVRGFKVHPEEVEDCILNSRLARDCFVYSRPDGDEDEVVCAEVVPLNPQVGVEAIRAYCSEHLAEYKRPREILLCETIRKNASGKTARH